METNDNRQPPTDAQVEQEKLEQEYMMDTGSVIRTKGRHSIHCLTVAGQIEGHTESPGGQKSTKYEFVIPLLVAIEEEIEANGYTVNEKNVTGNTYEFIAENNKTGFNKTFKFNAKTGYVRIYEIGAVTWNGKAKVIENGAGTYANGDTLTVVLKNEDGFGKPSYTGTATTLGATTTANGVLSENNTVLTFEFSLSGLTKDIKSWTLTV